MKLWGISSKVVVPGCNAISNRSRERAGMIKIDQLPRPANHVALNCKLVDGCAGTLQSRLLQEQ